jgi:hypothetical protein
MEIGVQVKGFGQSSMTWEPSKEIFTILQLADP